MVISSRMLSSFVLVLGGWFSLFFFFFNSEQTVHRSDVAEKKGYKLPFPGLE